MGFHDEERGLNALRRALAEVLQNGRDPEPIPITIHAAPGRPARGLDVPWLLTQTSQSATERAETGGEVSCPRSPATAVAFASLPWR